MHSSAAKRPALATTQGGGQGRLSRLSSLLENQSTLGYLLLAPTVLIVFGLIGYPFALSIYFSLTDKVIGESQFTFVGLKNFARLIEDSVFRKTLWNTFNYSVTAVLFKLGLGLIMALTLNEVVRLRRLIRASFLLPWVAPSSLTILAWVWMFDQQFSVITYVARSLGLVQERIPWLSNPTLAMMAVQTVNIWRGVPFFAMALLAALVTVPKDLYEAAMVDGANAWHRFWHVTLPSILPVMAVVTLFSFVQTVGDFQIVWNLTSGGPFDSTHLIATLAFRRAILGTNLAQGSAIAVFIFPVLVLIIILQIRYLRRE